MTGEGVETADNEELADMFSSVAVSSIRSSINSSDSPAKDYGNFNDAKLKMGHI